ncbi:hypothetical protein SERLA73DRAFT_182493 [Serpula lacrymans var. lacrymans S7.3]|uniref:Uncharacterized protein n=2 Tax=Serpula lacrymans var. lacrymans TaxID=341189 RepID=F8Q091_SERL3|nr:uncharacterized protein SERLADRAFT_469169 [Serpula lacrymans var. lacrymans S7.9]EGN97758.1 hypothetical protein SERLA73DRAFT_182493 [Serpula lacrymans var. lacrymans S7.3]EGO23349.1 hypothetical protein SERLADRAFT_469169 [Serpula lacrymans var. lacrymans S7.9]
MLFRGAYYLIPWCSIRVVQSSLMVSTPLHDEVHEIAQAYWVPSAIHPITPTAGTLTLEAIGIFA